MDMETNPTTTPTMRLQKWVAQLGKASRREAEQWIRDGRLSVNGTQAQIGQSIDPSCDQVTLDGRLLTEKCSLRKSIGCCTSLS